MSKSLGNTVDPIELVAEYGTDALRYYLTREISPFEDTPFTKEMFKDAYNANLANGLGNLVSRVMTMSEKNIDESGTGNFCFSDIFAGRQCVDNLRRNYARVLF